MRYLNWQLKFVSFSGYKCHVDIYQELSQAPESVIQLTGTDNPFEFQETDSTDLLEFFRYKTGYIRIVEKEGDDYRDIWPTDVFDRYIRAYYGGNVSESNGVWSGGNLVFTGFIQCQQLNNPFEARPTTIDIPIISPLGLAENVKCANYWNETPTLYEQQICRYLFDFCKQINADYKTITYPRNSRYPMDVFLPQYILCPINSEYKHYEDAEDKEWKKKNYKYLIDGICAWLGAVVHDTPEGIVFQQLDYQGLYSYINIEDPHDFQTFQNYYNHSDVKMPISQYFTFDDNEGELTTEMPIKKLTISADGGEGTEESLSTTNTQFLKFTDYNLSTPDNLEAVKTWASFQVGDSTVKADHFVADSSITSYGTFACCIDYKTEKSIKYAFRNSNDYAAGTLILSKTFYRAKIKKYMKMTISISKGTAYDNISQSDFKIKFSIKQNGKWAYLRYLNGAFLIDWEPQLTLNEMGRKMKIEMLASISDSYEPIEIGLYNDGLSADDIIVIDELKIEDAEYCNDGYQQSEIYSTEKVYEGSKSVLAQEKSITVNFHNYSSMICENYITTGTEDAGSIPPYKYIFLPQNFCKLKCRTISPAMLSQIAQYLYRYNRILSSSDTTYFRIISENFNLRDDEHTFLLTEDPS